MKIIYIVLGISLAGIIYIFLRNKKIGEELYHKLIMDTSPDKNAIIENYGGKQQSCEDACFSSEYYSACLNSCLQDNRPDYMETGSEYDVLGVAQVDDLDRGYNLDTPQAAYADNQRFGLRGQTAGR